MAIATEVLAQLGMLVNMVRNVFRVVFDPKMNSRISLKSALVDFFGMLVQESLTNPHLTCEEVADRCLGRETPHALRGRVAIVTGASSGLGAEHARVLLRRGCDVVLAVRSPGKAQALLEAWRGQGAEGRATILALDLDDLATIRPFVEAFLALGLPLHYLVNNAGVMTPKAFRASKQGYETQFATNHLGHFLLTELLLPKLRETRRSGADVRIVTLSSVGSTVCRPIDLDRLLPPDPSLYVGAAEYGISKALNLFHCRELQRRCADDGIVCCAVHPGVVRTGLAREGHPDTTMIYDSVLLRWLRKSVPEGAATQMYCTVSPEVPEQVLQQGACFWYNCAPQRAVGVAAPGVRDDLGAKLWAASERFVAPYR